MHALIIEDEHLVANVIQDVLRDLGYTSFHFARTEVEAIALAERRRPDLITADVQLAIGSGVGAVLTIAADRDVSTVFLTGAPQQIAKRMPDAIVVAKPFELSALADAIQTARTVKRAFLTI